MTEHFTVNLVVWNIVPVRALYRLYRGRQFWKWLVIPTDFVCYYWTLGQYSDRHCSDRHCSDRQYSSMALSHLRDYLIINF